MPSMSDWIKTIEPRSTGSFTIGYRAAIEVSFSFLIETPPPG